jgi:hypothetical protein
VGWNGLGTPSITNSYATGSVTDSVYSGGLVGDNNGTIGSSYWDTATTGQSVASGSGSASSNSDSNGRINTFMQQQLTFVGWDFTDTWGINEGYNYPYLRTVAPLPTVTASVSPSAAGTVNGEGAYVGTYDVGNTATVTATPNSGYSFVNWTGGGNTVSDAVYYTFTMGASNVNLVANFTTVTPTGGGGGVTSLYPPAVQTVAASTITATSAVLNGDITSDDGFNITDYGFIWGTSASAITKKLDVGTNNQSGAYMGTLSNLTTGTTYYFEAYATNSYGTSDDGAVMSFNAGAQTTTTPTTPSTQSSTVPVFSDVSTSYWGYDAISSLSSKGIISGYPDGTFKPDATITRAEFATMLVKALGLGTTGTTGQFTDVTAGSWLYGSVNAAAAAGLVSGLGNNQFGPYALITRQEMAMMVAKALGSKAPVTNGTELSAFKDASRVSSWATTGMDEVVKEGIVSGMTADTLAPMAHATREQAATMIYKMLNFTQGPLFEGNF